MSTTPADPDAAELRHWHEPDAGEAITAPGDAGSARQWLARSVGDAAAVAALRRTALALADGTDLSRIDDHQLLDQLAAAAAAGRLRSTGAPPELLRLVTAPALVAAPAPSPRPSASRAAPAAPPSAVETTFDSDLDAAAMAAVLVQASQDGVPFCEECAKAAAKRAAAEAVA